MKTGQHPVLFLFAALLMLAAGICLGLLWGETIPLAWGGFAILLVLALVLLWRKSPLCALTVLLLFLVLGIIRLQAMLDKYQPKKADTTGKKVYVCPVCGYEHVGDISVEDDSYVCPLCGQPKSAFVLKK